MEHTNILVSPGEVNHNLRVEINAIAHGGKIVKNDGQWALACNLIVEVIDDLGRGLFAKVAVGRVISSARSSNSESEDHTAQKRTCRATPVHNLLSLHKHL